MSQSKLFEPYALTRDMVLRNRIVMAPMTTWAADDDGTVSGDEEAYYRRRVKGVGLVVTGCTHVRADGVGFTGEFAAYDDRFVESLARLAAAAKSGGAPAILQIFHAGSKAPPELVREAIAPSAVASDDGPFNTSVMPRAMTETEIAAVVRAFGEATRRAMEAGFDGVELHGAHGFLIQNFLSPRFNRREDRWGGSIENRMRFPLAVVTQVREAIAANADRPFVLGYRISPEEHHEDGLRMADSVALVERLIEAGVDYIHASLSNALEARPIGHTDGPTVARILADLVDGRVPLVVAGHLRTPAQAERALDAGSPLVAVGQGLVMNPGWVEAARGELHDEIAETIAPGDVETLTIPRKLWTVIEATAGWFKVRQAA